ncbi:hypothetical protein ECC37_03390, partial [Helicobacter pylori]
MFKNGLFCFCHFKTHFKNISNSFYKGIREVFCDNTPLNPQLDPPNPPRPLFFRKYHLLTQALCYL